jgi:hypothetical protein
MKTQPGRVQALPNLHGFVPAPGIVEGSVGAEVGVGTTEDAVEGEEADGEGAFF